MLAIGDKMWAMSRQGRYWKANTRTEQYKLIEVPPRLADYTRQAQAHLAAPVLGLDFLRTRSGDYLTLESNDVPGLSGFPEEARLAIANLVRQQSFPA